MRIVSITGFEYRHRFDGKSWNPAYRWRERRVPLVAIETSVGVVGFGEGCCDQDQIGLFFAHLENHLAPRLLGEDASGFEAIRETLWRLTAPGALSWVAAATASAVDLALWDLAAKTTRQPIAGLLGAAGSSAPVYASGGLYADGKGLEALTLEMKSYVERGFETVKMKIGGLPLDEDIARVATVRRALGDRAIIVDAVASYDRDAAITAAGRLADLGVIAIQAPIDPRDIEGMKAIRRSAPIAVIGVETEFRFAAFEELIASGAVSWLQFNLGLAGGLSQGRRLIDLAESAGIPVTLQCHGTAVLLAHSLHCGAARPSINFVEYHMFQTHLYDRLPPCMQRIQQGRVMVEPDIGLGLTDPRDATTVRSIVTCAA